MTKNEKIMIFKQCKTYSNTYLYEVNIKENKDTYYTDSLLNKFTAIRDLVRDFGLDDEYIKWCKQTSKGR